jgi:hypothetical protein
VCRDEPQETIKTLTDPKTRKAVTGGKAKESTACAMCHVAVSYIRQALADKQTEKEIERVRASGAWNTVAARNIEL